MFSRDKKIWQFLAPTISDGAICLSKDWNKRLLCITYYFISKRRIYEASRIILPLSTPSRKGLTSFIFQGSHFFSLISKLRTAQLINLKKIILYHILQVIYHILNLKDSRFI